MPDSLGVLPLRLQDTLQFIQDTGQLTHGIVSHTLLRHWSISVLICRKAACVHARATCTMDHSNSMVLVASTYAVHVMQTGNWGSPWLRSMCDTSSHNCSFRSHCENSEFELCVVWCLCRCCVGAVLVVLVCGVCVVCGVCGTND